jgi:uncharacterized protein (TIGR02217 family)
MTFRNTRFPTGIRYGAVATPFFRTAIAQNLSGITQRARQWNYPLRRFRVERALKTEALRQALLAFFYNMNGAADTFRIKDFSDFEVGSGEGVFTSLGSNQYQMWKRYTSGAFTKDIPVYLPVNGSIVINGGALVESTHYTIDYTTPSGVVTLVGSPTPATPSTWTGEYDVQARFESDELPMEIEDEGLFFARTISIIEERNVS